MLPEVHFLCPPEGIHFPQLAKPQAEAYAAFMAGTGQDERDAAEAFGLFVKTGRLKELEDGALAPTLLGIWYRRYALNVN